MRLGGLKEGSVQQNHKEGLFQRGTGAKRGTKEIQRTLSSNSCKNNLNEVVLDYNPKHKININESLLI